LTLPNPLTDDLSEDAKAWLAAQFADLKRYFLCSPNVPAGMAVRLIRQRNPWDRL
jgi:hypothetical protein